MALLEAPDNVTGPAEKLSRKAMLMDCGITRPPRGLWPVTLSLYTSCQFWNPEFAEGSKTNCCSLALPLMEKEQA